jgi:crotonobetainyl-CoA:carnitine CoA-transferase CaiB-like acyl-CoA transferase
MPREQSSLARRTSKGLPLDGIVVADFTVFWAGPSATRTLADLGARTIWVERPGSRAAVDPEKDPGAASPALLFAAELGRNKESVVLDLQSAEGLAAAHALIARCDVVVENNRPGVMDKAGLGAREICARHPDLVYVSLPGFGSTGPWAQRRSYGPVIEAASGIVGRTGYQGDEPLRLGHPLPDAVGGLVGALTALRGLRHRDATGKGGWYDVSQLEAYVAICGEELIGGDPLPRIGNASRAGATIILLPCRGDDEWLAVRLVTPEERARFSREMGSADDEADVRAASRDAGKFALMERLQGAGLEAFPVMKPEDLVRDPGLWARSGLIEFPFAGRMTILAGSPYGSMADVSGTWPGFGQHTELVMQVLASSDNLAAG